MKNFKKTLLNGVKLAALLGLVLVVAGCEGPNATEPASIIGTWENVQPTYTETYTITSTEFSAGDYGYRGTIEEIVGTDDNKYIYIKYTKAYKNLGDTDGDGYDNFELSETAPDVGKYYAIHIKDLTATSMSLSGAYKYNGKTSTSTLAEAKTEFTIDKGYFPTGDGYSHLTKK